jgi:1,4-alpha-glucan branching enzyme
MNVDVGTLWRTGPAAAGNVVHADYRNQVVAFKRYTFDGDLILIVVNAGNSQWGSNDYGVNMGGESLSI